MGTSPSRHDLRPANAEPSPEDDAADAADAFALYLFKKNLERRLPGTSFEYMQQLLDISHNNNEAPTGCWRTSIMTSNKSSSTCESDKNVKMKSVKSKEA